MNGKSNFLKAMGKNGIPPPVCLIGDGKLHRFTVTGDRPERNSGWYVFHPDGIPAGAFGDWRGGISLTWCGKRPESMTEAERTAYRKAVEKIQKEREADEQRLHAEAREKAEALWNQAAAANPEHAYLIRKGVKPFGIRELDGKLVIPIWGPDGTLRGLQFIDTDGNKKFLSGSEIRGSYYPIGTQNGRVVIAEGYATGVSIHEATGYAVAVAFFAGNLLPVGEALHSKLPGTQIIIAADDDFKTDGNPGLTKATEAARAVNGLLSIPTFPANRGDRDSDFNDLMRLSGAEAVKKCLESAQPVEGHTIRAQWPEPSLFGEIETEDISCKLLPGYLGAFAQAVSDMTQTPSGLAVMMSLSAVAIALQKKFEVSPFVDEYTEPLNLWTVTSLEPGARKTPVKNEITRPLTLWEQAKADEIKDTVRQNRHIRDVAQKRVENLKAKAAKLDISEIDRESCLQEVFRIEEQTPEEILLPRIWIDDVTAERMQGLLASHGEKMGLISDEGGVFEVMAGLYTNGRFNVNIFLQAHAGAPVRVDRQGRTVTLHKPALTFGLAVQPGVLSDLATGSKARFRGNGLLARFLYCLPTSTVGSRNVSDHRRISEQVKAAYYSGIDTLLNIPTLYDEQGRERARILTLSPDAKSSWIQFSQYIESKLGIEGDLHSVKDWASKLPGAALRVAGLFYVVEHGGTSSVISAETMERSLDLCDLLISHAKAAFDLMGDDEVTGDAKAIFKWIVDRRLETFTQREALKRHEGRLHRVDRLKKALAELTDRYIISEPDRVSTGRRPSVIYKVNPKIYGGEVL